jgi:hypothetical protein
MSLLVGLPQSSGGRVRSSPHPASSSSSLPWLFTLTFTWEMNNRPVGGHSSDTSHTIDMIDQSINQLEHTSLCNRNSHCILTKSKWYRCNCSQQAVQMWVLSEPLAVYVAVLRHIRLSDLVMRPYSTSMGLWTTTLSSGPLEIHRVVKTYLHLAKCTNSYSHHILSTCHTYGTLEDNLKIVKIQRKGLHLNTLERFYISKENKIGLLLNDTYTDQYNPLFELVTSVQEGEDRLIENLRKQAKCRSSHRKDQRDLQQDHSQQTVVEQHHRTDPTSTEDICTYIVEQTQGSTWQLKTFLTQRGII